MCVIITYHCPRCETASGFRDRKECENDDECPGMVKIKRWNQPRHFHNWFCGNDACDYSRVARAVNALEVEDILEAQEMGHARPVLPKVPQAPNATASAAATEVPTKEGAEKATDGPSPGPSSAPTSPKSWVDITTLSDTVQKQIRELRIKINRLGTKKSMWWSKEETQLLGLCRNFKLPMHQITSYLPRHDTGM